MDNRYEGQRTPQRERKNNRAKHLTQAYVPALMLVVALIGIALIITGAVRSGKSKEEQAAANSTLPADTSAATQDTLLEEGRRIMDQAAIRAAQYDYDGAIALLNSYSGDPSDISGMTEALTSYTNAKGGLVLWQDNTKIPHLSFQPLIADTDRAFDGDANESYYKDYNFTIAQFSEILQQLYDNDYVLVSMHDVALLTTDAEGNTSFQSVDIYLPEGKKPLLLSQVPVNYYLDTVDGDGDGAADAKGDGFACRLVVGEDGKILSEMVSAQGETVTGAYDIVPVLDAFIENHLDFSYHGAKAILGITGYDGVLGYRGADQQGDAANVAQALLNDGYSFACFSYDSIPYGSSSAERVAADLQKWQDEVVPVIGGTDVVFFVGGSDLTDTGTAYSGSKYEALYDAGFRYFVGMGASAWAQFGSSYVRQSRTTVNPAKLADSASLFSRYFTASEITAIS